MSRRNKVSRAAERRIRKKQAKVAQGLAVRISTLAVSEQHIMTILTQPSTSTPDFAIPDASNEDVDNNGVASNGFGFDDDNVIVEELPTDDPSFKYFAQVFAKHDQIQNQKSYHRTSAEPEKPEVFRNDDDNVQDEEEEAETQKRLSRKARKKVNKLSVAELKAIVNKPESVEWTDTDAQDPKLLVNIKSARNVIPVPNHWSLKREYLSGKRGIEKPSFALPKFISETGISTMRDAVLEKQAEASLKQKQRERVQPKMGKLDIDYQKYYEAFFRRQTKPSLSRYGEVYYEGKEFETNLRHLRPGELSDELREALNMPIGAPPPWLINMQKIGLPPSYPALKIPGLNAPPPPGQSWGLQPGGYGKPPTDENNAPLYGGDIFGAPVTDRSMQDAAEDGAQPMDKSLWGELQPFQDEEDEEEEEDDEDDAMEDEDVEDADEMEGVQRSGTEIPYGGTETPALTNPVSTPFPGTQTMSEELNIRKDRRGNETEPSQYPRSAGTVLEQRQVRAQGVFPSAHGYDLSGTSQARPSNGPVLDSDRSDRGRKRKTGDIDVSMDVDALERNDRMTKEEISRQYETERAQQGSGVWPGSGGQEDFSNMVAEESAKRQKRDKERERDRRGKR